MSSDPIPASKASTKRPAAVEKKDLAGKAVASTPELAAKAPAPMKRPAAAQAAPAAKKPGRGKQQRAEDEDTDYDDAPPLLGDYKETAQFRALPRSC